MKSPPACLFACLRNANSSVCKDTDWIAFSACIHYRRVLDCLRTTPTFTVPHKSHPESDLKSRSRQRLWWSARVCGRSTIKPAQLGRESIMTNGGGRYFVQTCTFLGDPQILMRLAEVVMEKSISGLRAIINFDAISDGHGGSSSSFFRRWRH